MERKLRQIEQSAKNHYTSPVTDSELSELEDQLAATAAKVQNTESEVEHCEKNFHLFLIYCQFSSTVMSKFKYIFSCQVSDIENKIAVLSASGLSIDKAKKKVNLIFTQYDNNM